MDVGFLFGILQGYFTCFKHLKIIKKKLLVFLFNILEGYFKCFKILKIIKKKVTSISL